MKYVPHDYQAYCIQRVVEDPAVGLFLRPGLGKTVITLSAVNILKYFRWQVQKVLVVAPKKVAEATWSKEAAKWDHLQHLRTSVVLGSATKRIKALNTPADIYVINRENVEWLVDYYKQAWPFDMVVLDESTSFKNSQSKRWKAMRRVRRFIKRMVLLTGTPSSKGLIDLWAQVYLLDCGERLGQSLSAYRERYFDPDQRSRTQIFSYKAKDGAESAVLDAISDICISMKAEDYAAEIVDLKGIIEAKLQQCIYERNRLERYITTIEDSLLRQVFTYRFVNGLPWQQVAACIGGSNTADGVRMMCNRYIKATEPETDDGTEVQL